MQSRRELLFKAIAGRDITELKKLIEAKVDVNYRDFYGNTALMVASLGGHIEIARLLVEAGAVVNAQHDNGLASLMYVSVLPHQYQDVAKFLIEAGADVNAKDNEGRHSLDMASYRGHKDIVQLLIEAGANVNAQTDMGNTALIIASEYGHAEVAQLLLEAGADVNTQGNTGFTALMFAAEHGHTEVAQLLLEEGADVNTQSNEGFTALMLASVNRYPEITKLLIGEGADVSIRDNNNWTALMYAIKEKHTEITQLLIPSNLKFGKDQTLIHVYSGAVFEEKIGDLKRINASQLDDVGEEVGVEYKYKSDFYEMYLTVYVYPTRAGTATKDCIRKHYQYTKNAIFVAKEDVNLVFEQEDVFNFPSGNRFGMFAGFNLEMKNEKNMSFLYLFGEKEWFIKFRISSPTTEHVQEDVSNAITNIVSSFDYSTIN